jgi:hypothetical protein
VQDAAERLVVKLMAEYSVTTPLWGEWEDLELPAQLLARLENWQGDYLEAAHPGLVAYMREALTAFANARVGQDRE